MTDIHRVAQLAPAEPSDPDPATEQPAPSAALPEPPRRQIRPHSLSRRSLALAVLREPRLTPSDITALADRPRTWGDCRGHGGPCPWVGCRAHMWLEVSKAGSIKLNFPALAGPEELAEPCALRLASAGEMRLDDIARRANITRQRVQQIIARAIGKLAEGEEPE